MYMTRARSLFYNKHKMDIRYPCSILHSTVHTMYRAFKPREYQVWFQHFYVFLYLKKNKKKHYSRDDLPLQLVGGGGKLSFAILAGFPQAHDDAITLPGSQIREHESSRGFAANVLGRRGEREK